MKVLLICAMGMSTSILMKKLEKHAEEQGIEFEIAAQSVNSYKSVCHEYDCILMGPQISYQKDSIASATGMPVAVIPPTDYGTGNCANIFKLIESLIQG